MYMQFYKMNNFDALIMLPDSIMKFKKKIFCSQHGNIIILNKSN